MIPISKDFTTQTSEPTVLNLEFGCQVSSHGSMCQVITTHTTLKGEPRWSVRLQTEPKNLTPFDFCGVRVVTSTHSDCPMSLDAPMIYLKYQHQSHHLATWESASDPNTRFYSILQFQSQQSSKKKRNSQWSTCRQLQLLLGPANSSSSCTVGVVERLCRVADYSKIPTDSNISQQILTFHNINHL